MVSKMKQILHLSALTAACVLGLATTASAQITWQTSVNMYQSETVQTFVDTNGVGLVAYNASGDTGGDQNPVVNDVAFTGTLTGTTLVGVGGHSITLTGGNDNVGSFGDGEFTSDADIFHLIRGATFGVESVTLDGLVVGTDYSIQIFTNDARGNRTNLFMTRFGDGSGTSTEPTGFSDLNNSPAGSMVDPDTGNNVPIPPTFPETDAGDSIIGTFTATSTSLTFNVFGSNTDPATFNAGSTGDGRAQINGIQLRDVSNVVVNPDVIKGDVDQNGGVTFLDISPFIGVLSSNGFQAEADCDCDGMVTFLDIQPFINILAGN
jgi:hypothetical protein